MAVGMVSPDIFDEIAEDHTVDFVPGNLLMLYTDGITESESLEKEEFGLNRLIQCFDSAISLEPNSLNANVLDSLDRFSSKNFERDDLTLVTVKRI